MYMKLEDNICKRHRQCLMLGWSQLMPNPCSLSPAKFPQSPCTPHSLSLSSERKYISNVCKVCKNISTTYQKGAGPKTKTWISPEFHILGKFQQECDKSENLLQSTLPISTSVISNNRLSRSEILVPILT